MIDEPNLDELIRKGSSINAIISPAFVWIVGSKFGLTINAVQVWVTSMPQQMRGFAFRTEGGAGAPIPGASMPSVAAGGGATRKFQLQDDDDDDEVANK